ncbi:hypothetical protein EXN66_Car005974 [Channa argus]|uniref:Uncharacterized protein n=1 Tax=Channa argus TaxID=215402 RepID=A0A6G1PJ76_CHAAH|nr:hypothetical protein EXN66_Car005974 [Channa argus]
MVRSRSLVLRFIPASLAGAQSELQPGNRAHAEPQCLLAARSPPLASVSLIVFNHPPPPSPLPPHPALAAARMLLLTARICLGCCSDDSAGELGSKRQEFPAVASY